MDCFAPTGGGCPTCDGAPSEDGTFPERLLTPEETREIVFKTMLDAEVDHTIQLDTTGLEGLENLRDKLAKRGCTLIVCGLNSQPGSLLYRSGFIDDLGNDNVVADLTEALKRASARGVKIILHTNSGASTDAIFPQAFFMNDWMQLMKDCPTLRLMVAKDASQRLHSKCFVFDGQYSVVGTYNLDPLSDNVNSEVVALVEGTDFGTMLRNRIYTDFAPCLEYKIEVGRDGKVNSLMGPEHHIDEKLLKKMNLLRKVQWLRPLI